MLILLCLVIAIVVSPMFIPHQFVVAYKKRLLNISDKSKIRSKEVSRFTTGLRYQLGHTILTTTLNFFNVCVWIYSNVFGNIEYSRMIFVGDTRSSALGFYWYFSLFGVQYTVLRGIRLPHVLGYTSSIVCSYILDRIVNPTRKYTGCR